MNVTINCPRASQTENNHAWPRDSSAKRSDEMASSLDDLDMNDGGENHPKTGHPNRGIVDLLEHQIRCCTSESELQRARQLTAHKKPTTKTSSWTFKSVIDELNFETTSAVTVSSTRTSIQDSILQTDSGDVKLINNPDDGTTKSENISRLSITLETVHVPNVWTPTDSSGRSRFSQKKYRRYNYNLNFCMAIAISRPISLHLYFTRTHNAGWALFSQ